MKIQLPILIASIATTLSCTTPAISQVTLSAKKPILSNSEAPKVQLKLDLVEFLGPTVGVAVSKLHAELDDRGLPPVNVLFGPATEDIKIPELRLRNVTGPDALRLIATAADCELESILSVDDLKPKSRYARPDQDLLPAVIGYRIVGNPQSNRGFGFQQMKQNDGMTYAPVATSYRTHAAGSTIPKSTPSIPGQPAPARPAPKAPKESLATSLAKADRPELSGGAGSSGSSGAAGGLGGGGRRMGIAGAGGVGMSAPGMAPGGMGGIGGGSGVMSMGYDPFSGGNQPEPIVTRVYALARITSFTQFPDLEKTLLEILDLSGTKSDDAKISLHEKTNVLVVRARGSVHELVAQFLSSLEKNAKEADSSAAAKAERRYQSLISEVKIREQQMELKLQDAERQRARTEQEMEARLRESDRQRSQAEAEARKIQKELLTVQDRIKSQQK